MKIVNWTAWSAVVLALTVVPSTSQALSKLELKCSSKLPKEAAKLSKTIVKEISKCRDNDISGKETGLCPNAGNLAKILKAQDKLASTVAKSCVSVCAFSSEITCISDKTCPARPGVGEGAEKCSAGAKGLPFDIANLGFPGALCPSLVGDLLFPSDVSDCVDNLTTQASEALIDSVYGSVVNASGLSAEAVSCVSAIAKATAKLVSTAFKGVAKCRGSIDKGKLTLPPDSCLTDEPKTADKVAKTEEKLAAAVASRCSDATIQELDICGNGIGGTTSVAEAQTCLTQVAREIVDAREEIVSLRSTGVFSLVEAVYPPAPVCGDGIVNQNQNPFQLVGEECDGTDDDACPGDCFPPGDHFQCTCATVKRTDFETNGLLTEIDTGWTGASHDSETVQGAGNMSVFSDCDCSEMTGADCTGTSTDPVCEVYGFTGPRCSWDPKGSIYCDDFGDGNGVNTDKDCYVCDGFAANAGTSCTDSNDCSPICYDAAGTAGAACPGGQAACGAGEICRGRCLTDVTCLLVPLSPPTPLSSSGNATCLTTTFREDVTGTTNIVTGERAVFQILRTTVYTGPAVSVPCPICGGVCEGGTQDGEVCEGTCSVSGDDCRFDVDCPPSETCTSVSAACPGGACSLELVCHGGANDGGRCRIGGYTPSFGTTSSDCLPDSLLNISGNGMEINFAPSTTEPVSLPSTIPCTAPGFELYDCPCPATGGRPTAPNDCIATCDNGDNFGIACADGNTNGQFTKCADGINAGKACDEDSDCPDSSCSDNPTHCVGDPATARFACTTNADCGLGTCEDACPLGRCTKLCVPDPADPQDGLCIGGPIEYHCDGAGETFRICGESQAGGGCTATCSVSGTLCEADSQCPSGESCSGPCTRAQLCEAGEDGLLGTPDDITGAGVCVGEERNCFLDPIVAEGGDIFNGEGDPTNVKAVTVYCVPATTSSIINNAAGIGGPGRVRTWGINISNGFSSLP